jgi:thiomorpholine-carboxylate dehydrogenase
MYIFESEVGSLLTFESLIPAIRQALIDFSAGRLQQPPRMILRSDHAEGPNNGWFAVMPVIYGDVMAVKTVTFFPGNAALGLHTHTAVVELLSRRTGEPLALMDGRLITEMRTAAVSAVALDALARTDVSSLGILGSGVQARSHLKALRMVRPGLMDVRIWSRTIAKAERLAEEASARAVPLEEASSADVVLTVTASPEPVLRGQWLRKDALVLAVGAVGAQLRELDDEAVRSAWVVAESRAAAEREAGDLVLSGLKVQAEIGEILARPDEFPVPRSGRILFKSVGMAIEDLVAARLVWENRSSDPAAVPVHSV